jgi:hypothetical protein
MTQSIIKRLILHIIKVFVTAVAVVMCGPRVVQESLRGFLLVVKRERTFGSIL